jgi:hypothetical protein
MLRTSVWESISQHIQVGEWRQWVSTELAMTLFKTYVPRVKIAPLVRMRNATLHSAGFCKPLKRWFSRLADLRRAVSHSVREASETPQNICKVDQVLSEPSKCFHCEPGSAFAAFSSKYRNLAVAPRAQTTSGSTLAIKSRRSSVARSLVLSHCINVQFFFYVITNQ